MSTKEPHPSLDLDDELIKKIIQETAPIPWTELQRFFAAGQVVQVHSSLDLVLVAKKFSDDDSGQIEKWMDENLLGLVNDDTAEYWLDIEAELWTSVVAPWILVQRKAS